MRGSHCECLKKAKDSTHTEYNAQRLVEEYLRDLKEMKSGVEQPKNLDINNPINRWKGQGSEFFSQWIKCIHDNISFRMTDIDGKDYAI